MNNNTYQACIDACLRCASICDQCATACLHEKEVKMMAHCIQLDRECASICYSAAQLMSLQSIRANEICKICAEICNACAIECEKHDMQHCKECAEACRFCEKECKKMAA